MAKGKKSPGGEVTYQKVRTKTINQQITLRSLICVEQQRRAALSIQSSVLVLGLVLVISVAAFFAYTQISSSGASTSSDAVVSVPSSCNTTQSTSIPVSPSVLNQS